MLAHLASYLQLGVRELLLQVGRWLWEGEPLVVTFYHIFERAKLLVKKVLEHQLKLVKSLLASIAFGLIDVGLGLIAGGLVHEVEYLVYRGQPLIIFPYSRRCVG